MPIFRTPTVDEAPAGTGRLFYRYKLKRGISVLKNGSVYSLVRTPSLDECNLADVVYLGGHDHEVTNSEKTALIAAGIGITESNFT
jgi:hypothetical protein